MSTENDSRVSSSLDLVISGVAPDEVTVAASKLVSQIEDRYDPYVSKSETFLVDLEDDPVSHGLAHFNSTLAKIRNNANQVAGWLMEVTAEKRKAQRRRDAARTAFDEKLHLTLSSDPVVLDTDGQQAKLALAKEKLSREARVVAYAEQIYTMVLGYHEALKLISDQLSDTKRDLMAQLAVIKQQIALGEVNPDTFPVERPGYGPPTNSHQELEERIAAELPSPSGYTDL